MTKTRELDMILLPETMVNEKKITTILPLTGYDHFAYDLPTNHQGGDWRYYGTTEIFTLQF